MSASFNEPAMTLTIKLGITEAIKNASTKSLVPNFQATIDSLEKATTLTNIVQIATISAALKIWRLIEPLVNCFQSLPGCWIGKIFITLVFVYAPTQNPKIFKFRDTLLPSTQASHSSGFDEDQQYAFPFDSIHRDLVGGWDFLEPPDLDNYLVLAQ
jgi:hypothetical protein